MMGMSLSLGTYQRHQVSQRLTLKQRIAIKEILLGLGIELAGALVGVKYNPKNSCPACQKELTLAEILKGYYQNNPTDLTTKCPYCRIRFEANLVSNYVRLRWYCPDQTLYALEGKENLSPKKILEWNPSVYHSAVTHFGSIKNAFLKNGINDYDHQEVLEWEKKVVPFLGKMPDTAIAEIVGVNRNKIADMRARYRISVFRKYQLV